MDEIVTTINDALSFINFIQSNCNLIRTALETSYDKEFRHYIKKWKNEQEEEEEKQCEEDEIIQDELKVLHLDEIIQADNILKKARQIREKFKVPLFDEDYNLKYLNKNLPKKTISNMCQKESVPNKLFFGKKLKQSQSMPSINSNKVNVTNSLKLRNNLKETGKNRGTLPREKKSSLSNNGGSTIITQSQLCSYQDIYESHNLKNEVVAIKSNFSMLGFSEEKCCGGNKTSKKHLSIASNKPIIYFTKEKHCPTYRDFLNFTYGCQKSFELDFQHSFWYPYLDSVVASYLIGNIKCQNVKELHQMHALLHNIQEIAFWLDFLKYVEELIPHVDRLNRNSQEFAMMSSYIQSFFHPKLRRKPVILSKLD